MYTILTSSIIVKYSDFLCGYGTWKSIVRMYVLLRGAESSSCAPARAGKFFKNCITRGNFGKLSHWGNFGKLSRWGNFGKLSHWGNFLTIYICTPIVQIELCRIYTHVGDIQATYLGSFQLLHIGFFPTCYVCVLCWNFPTFLYSSCSWFLPASSHTHIYIYTYIRVSFAVLFVFAVIGTAFSLSCLVLIFHLSTPTGFHFSD